MSKYKKFKILNFTFWDILKKHRIFNFYLNTKREESHYLGSEIASVFSKEEKICYKTVCYTFREIRPF